MPIEASRVSDLTISGKARRARPPDRAAERARPRSPGTGSGGRLRIFLASALSRPSIRPAGVAARVGHPHQLEVGDDVLVPGRDVVERLEEVEGDVGLSSPGSPRRIDAEVAPRPRAASTSWPISRRVLTTSNSVFQGACDARRAPAGSSGGTRSSCTRARTRCFFMAAHRARRRRPLWRSFTICTVSRTGSRASPAPPGTARRRPSSRQRSIISPSTWSMSVLVDAGPARAPGAAPRGGCARGTGPPTGRFACSGASEKSRRRSRS